jgi:hypothetical protein
MHLILVVGGRSVKHVPPEVHTEESLGMAPLPDKAREGLLQGLPEPVVCIACGHAQKFLRCHAR